MKIISADVMQVPSADPSFSGNSKNLFKIFLGVIPETLR